MEVGTVNPLAPYRSFLLPILLESPSTQISRFILKLIDIIKGSFKIIYLLSELFVPLFPKDDKDKYGEDGISKKLHSLTCFVPASISFDFSKNTFTTNHKRKVVCSTWNFHNHTHTYVKDELF